MKTIEQAAEEYAKSNWETRLSNNVTGTDFKAGIEFAQRWIPVEEKLPDLNKYGFSELVLTKLNETVIIQKGYTNKRNRFIWCDKQPTYWRPIERI